MSLLADVVAGSGGTNRRSPFSESLGPAGGSLEYELRLALDDSRRWIQLLSEAQEQRDQWERAAVAAERERLRLQAELKEIQAGVRLLEMAREERGEGRP